MEKRCTKCNVILAGSNYADFWSSDPAMVPYGYDVHFIIQPIWDHRLKAVLCADCAIKTIDKALSRAKAAKLLEDIKNGKEN